MKQLTSKWPFIALALAIVAYIVFGHPALQPEFANRKAVKAADAKKEFDTYSKKLSQAKGLEAKRKQELAEKTKREAADLAALQAAREKMKPTFFVPTHNPNFVPPPPSSMPGANQAMATRPLAPTNAFHPLGAVNTVESGNDDSLPEAGLPASKSLPEATSGARPRRPVLLDKTSIQQILTSVKERSQKFVGKDGKIPNILATAPKDDAKFINSDDPSVKSPAALPKLQPPTVQESAAKLAAPVSSSSAMQNAAATRQLTELEEQENGQAGLKATNSATNSVVVGRNSKKSPLPKVALRPAVFGAPGATGTKSSATVTIVSQTPTSRFLYFKLADSIVRFYVDPSFGDRELNTVVQSLGSACVKAVAPDRFCDPERRTSVTVDQAFFADVELMHVADWSKATTPVGQMWKLSCLSGGEDCFAPSARIRKFKLTTKRDSSNPRIIAHGFESEAVHPGVKKRVPAASPQLKLIEKVYVTRTTQTFVPHLPKGSL